MSDDDFFRLRGRAIKEARLAREHLGLGLDRPVPDILEAVEGDDVAVALMDLGDGLAGAYLCRLERPVAFVNGRHAPQRQRFTLAHEYGHHWLGHGDKVDEPSALADFTRPTVEMQANMFAAEFLMPRPAVLLWARRRLDPPVSLESVVRFAAHFGVSAQAACLRLKTLDLLGGRALADRLLGEIAECLHYGMVEDLELAVPDDGIAHESDHLPRLPETLRRSAFGDLLAGDRDVEGVARRIGREPAELQAAIDGLGLAPLVAAAR